MALVEDRDILRCAHAATDASAAGGVVCRLGISEVLIDGAKVIVHALPELLVPWTAWVWRKVSNGVHIERMQRAPESVKVITQWSRKAMKLRTQFFFEEIANGFIHSGDLKIHLQRGSIDQSLRRFAQPGRFWAVV